MYYFRNGLWIWLGSLLLDFQNKNDIVCFSGFLLWRYKKAARKAILLLGLSDAGKTVIYTQLLHHKFVRTHTSVKENSGEYDCGKVRSVIIYNVYNLYSMLPA